MDDKKLLKEISEIKLRITELEKKLSELEDGSKATGVYLDGCPDYVSDYIKNKSNEERGV